MINVAVVLSDWFGKKITEKTVYLIYRTKKYVTDFFLFYAMGSFSGSVFQTWKDLVTYNTEYNTILTTQY